MSVYFLNMPLGKITITSVAHSICMGSGQIAFQALHHLHHSHPQTLSPNSSLATLINLSIAMSISEVSFWRQVTHLEAFSLGGSGPWPTAEAMGKAVLRPRPIECPDSGDAQLSAMLPTPHSNPRAPGTVEFSVFPIAPSSQQYSLSSYLSKNFFSPNCRYFQHSFGQTIKVFSNLENTICQRKHKPGLEYD